MIPVVVGAHPGTKNLLTFRSLSLNNPADDEKDTYIIEEIIESDLWQQNFEPLPNRDGSQGYEPFALYKMFQVRGWVRGDTIAEMFDKINALNTAFHPVNCYAADTSTFNRGYLPIDFDVPTADTANYATGFIPSRYYVQALRAPVQLESKFDGNSARIDFLMRAIDPRRYLQTSSQAQRTGSGGVTVNNALATYHSWPVITIALPAGAPAGTYVITTSTGSQTISIDATQLAASTTYTLDTEARTFVKTSDGTNKIAAISGASTFFSILPQSQTVTFTSFPASSTLTVTWRRAFV